MRKIVPLILILVVAAPAFGQEATALRSLVCEYLKTAPLDVKLSLGKVRLKSADENKLVAESGPVQMSLDWKKITPRDLVVMTREACSGNPKAQLVICEYAMESGVGDEMQETIGRIASGTGIFAEQAVEMRKRIQESIKAAKEASSSPRPVIPAVATTIEGVRKNHEGRKLPPTPKIDAPVMFNTPKADEIMASLQVFPVNNPWNEDITKLPVHPNSDKIIESMNPRAHISYNPDMNFVIVPPKQKLVDVKIISFASESDRGPFPIPDVAPIEGWPAFAKGLPLDRYFETSDGDRHVIVLDLAAMKTFEFWSVHRKEGKYDAECAAAFDLTSNKLRPLGWTSADAAGLPIFPAIVRFDECERGMVEHALRVTARSTGKGFIWPAIHDSPKGKDPNLPLMGQRFRLKADVKIDHFPKHARAIALALKKYGMIVADNGQNWYLSTSADDRIQGLEALKQLHGSDFEVIETTPEFGAGRFATK